MDLKIGKEGERYFIYIYFSLSPHFKITGCSINSSGNKHLKIILYITLLREGERERERERGRERERERERERGRERER